MSTHRDALIEDLQNHAAAIRRERSGDQFAADFLDQAAVALMEECAVANRFAQELADLRIRLDTMTNERDELARELGAAEQFLPPPE